MPRPLNEWRLASKETYRTFCSKFPNYKLSFEKYKKIIYKYNTLLASHILETGDKIKLPYGLGNLTIGKYKPAKFKATKDGRQILNLPIDWAETKKQGKKIYHMNYHTDGYKFHWLWRWQEARIKCSYIWTFKINRVHSRMLKNYLKKPNSEYKHIYKVWIRKKHR